MFNNNNTKILYVFQSFRSSTSLEPYLNIVSRCFSTLSSTTMFTIPHNGVGDGRGSLSMCRTPLSTTSIICVSEKLEKSKAKKGGIKLKPIQSYRSRIRDGSPLEVYCLLHFHSRSVFIVESRDGSTLEVHCLIHIHSRSIFIVESCDHIILPEYWQYTATSMLSKGYFVTVLSYRTTMINPGLWWDIVLISWPNFIRRWLSLLR